MTLVLSRRINEEIIIGSNGEIRVRVAHIGQNEIRLEIDCPDNVPVHRKEVYDAMQRENQGAGKLEEAAAQPVPQLIPVKPQETPYQQFIKYLDIGNFREAGKIYAETNRNFEASHIELDKLSKGLYELVQRRK